ncbi:hypothetical protein Fmac_014460 [Flemingia macrophylla]|uniref:Uncharacterized protein n=1 Tax=Flemingia macrophylla TaxID=520843 RepID=A0ABD1MBX4_9FABA
MHYISTTILVFTHTRKKGMRKPCCEKEGTNKGAWSKQEDQKLVDYIQTHGAGRWCSLPKAAGLHRCGKSCRLRWINYLRPNIKRGNFAQDEEDLIIKLHALLGNRWSLIAGRLPGRTDNEVKNYWNSHIRRKLIKMGIDPNNHKLHQTFPVPKPSPSTTSTAQSSANNNDRVSDTQSCLVEETATVSSTSRLNLDLTIAFSPPTNALLEEHKSRPTSQCTNIIHEDSAPSGLLLFL